MREEVTIAVVAGLAVAAGLAAAVVALQPPVPSAGRSPEPAAAAATLPSIDLPVPDAPGALVLVDFPSRPPAPPEALPPASVPDRAAALPDAGDGAFLASRSGPEAASPGIREAAPARGAMPAPVALLPPPRPSFAEIAAARDGASPAGIREVRPAGDVPAWSEASLMQPGWPVAAAALPVAAAPPPARPERPLQHGVASWYGPGFHGRRTASGERFDQNALTAAHRTLPFGTRVKVVEPRTGRSVVVRINDRGPFSHGRVIDLSKASAEALGMGGLARVQLVSAE